jgi:hypothetical protein
VRSSTVFAALAAASQPLDAKSLAAQFKRTKTTERKVGDVLASLARLGYATSEDGKVFGLRGWRSERAVRPRRREFQESD